MYISIKMVYIYIYIYIYIKEEQLQMFIVLLSLFGDAFQSVKDSNIFGQSISFLICKNRV